MRKMVLYLLVCAILVASSGSGVVVQATEESVYRQFYIDAVHGSDENSGEKHAPFQTLERGRMAVRACNAEMTGDIIVNIAPGRYHLQQAIEFDISDSGKNGHRVIYRGAKETMPVLSGGEQITGFVAGENGIWHTQVDLDSIREISINGVMAQRARTQNKIFGVDYYNPIYTEYENDPTRRIVASDGIYVSKADLGLYENPADMEFFFEAAHLSSTVHVKDIFADPDHPENVVVLFQNPFWNSVCNQIVGLYNAPTSNSGRSAGYEIGFIVENAFELLDEPGEFYYNKQTKTLYYMPREGEDLTTAEIICPVTDKLVGIEGRGVNGKLTNLTFENLTFAHTTWHELNEYSIAFLQANRPDVTYAGAGLTQGVVDISWADGITIQNCHFYGMTKTAVRLYKGVTNAKLIGNTFHDLGDSAISIGNDLDNALVMQDTDASTETRGNVMYLKGWSSSWEQARGASYLNKVISSEYYYTNEVYTNAEELAAYPDARSWIRVDLGRPYHIDEIRLGFIHKPPHHIYTDAEASHFEVLGSNDRTFKTYDILETVETSYAGKYLRIQNLQNAKFRYIMVRKTVAEPFAIGVMYVYSNDVDRVGNSKNALCTDNIISNNYITRVGLFNRGAPAIVAYYTENITIAHNEIEQVPYSGISVGWGWELPNTVAKNNKVLNNKIRDFMCSTNDGGGIYTSGVNTGTVICGNYIVDGLNGYGGIYPDGGTIGIDISRNVCDNTAAPVFIANESIKDITGTENYSNSGEMVNCGIGCTIEQVIEYTSENYPDGAVHIIQNAGLEEDFAHVRARSPDRNSVFLGGPYATYSNGRKSERRFADFTNGHRRTNQYIAYLERVLEFATFGYEPWQYDPVYRGMIQELLDRARLDPNAKANPNGKEFNNHRGPHIDEMYQMKALIEQMRASVTHLSYEELQRKCSALLATATEGTDFGQYKEGAVSAFRSAVAAATEAGQLEDAIDRLASQQISDEVLYAYLVDQARDEAIGETVELVTMYGRTALDHENKIVTTTLPKGQALVIPNLAGKNGTRITVAEPDVITPDCLIPITMSNGNAQSTAWKLKLVYQRLGNAVNVLTADSVDWYNSNPNTAFKANGGKQQFQPWCYPYMYKLPVLGTLTFKVKADRPDAGEGFSFLLAAKAGADLEYDGSGYKNTYYKVSVKDQKAELYAVLGGKATCVAQTDAIGFQYGMYNEITLQVITEQGLDRITMKIGDNTIFDQADVGAIGREGYFGILTKSVKLELDPSVSTTGRGTRIPHEHMKAFPGNGEANQKEWAGTADASSELVGNVIDGKAGTTFSSEKTGMLVIDLGAAYTISDIRIKMGGNYPDNAKAYEGVMVYCSTEIPEEIQLHRLSGISLKTDEERRVVRSLFTLIGDVGPMGTVYPKEEFLSKVYKFRYIVVMKNYSCIDIAEIDVYTTDPLQQGSDVVNVAPLAAKIATTSYSNRYDIATENLVEANAADHDIQTSFLSYGSRWKDRRMQERFIVDLGASAHIAMIRYISNLDRNNVKNFTISVSNKGDFSDRRTLLTVAEDDVRGSNQVLPVNDAYRYVLVEASNLNQEISVSELTVYAAQSQVQAKEVFEISSAKRAVTYAESGSSEGVAHVTELANQKIFISQNGLARNGDAAYMYVDLGGEYHIESVALVTDYSPSCVWEDTTSMTKAQNLRSNYQIFGMQALPEPGGSDYQTYSKYALEFANHVIGAENTPFLLENAQSTYTSGLCMLGLTETAKTQKFRYIGIIKIPKYDGAGQMVADGQICMSQFRVYAAKTDCAFAFETTAAPSHEGDMIEIRTAGIAAHRADTCQLITVYYDQNKSVQEICTEPIRLEVPDRGYAFYYRYPIPDGAAGLKAFVLSDFDHFVPVGKAAEYTFSP